MVIHAISQSSLSSLLCAAGIGRTAQAAPGTGVPAQTACRETYGLLLYAGVAQSVEQDSRVVVAICGFEARRLHQRPGSARTM